MGLRLWQGGPPSGQCGANVGRGRGEWPRPAGRPRQRKHPGGQRASGGRPISCHSIQSFCCAGRFGLMGNWPLPFTGQIWPFFWQKCSKNPKKFGCVPFIFFIADKLGLWLSFGSTDSGASSPGEAWMPAREKTAFKQVTKKKDKTPQLPGCLPELCSVQWKPE